MVCCYCSCTLVHACRTLEECAVKRPKPIVWICLHACTLVSPAKRYGAPAVYLAFVALGWSRQRSSNGAKRCPRAMSARPSYARHRRSSASPSPRSISSQNSARSLARRKVAQHFRFVDARGLSRRDRFEIPDEQIVPPGVLGDGTTRADFDGTVSAFAGELFDLG